jgi:large subunit ribosomal protein L25
MTTAKKEIEIKAENRKETRKKVKTLRDKGIIPAVVYGAGHKPVSIQVNAKEFNKTFQETGETTLLKLKIGDHSKNVLIHDIARDPVENNIIHIDFYEVKMDQQIKTEVPLVFEGEAPAVKNLGGILVKNLTEIKVEALPKDLPREIKVDISKLETLESHIRIKDLVLPAGVKTLEETEETIVLVEPPRSEEELAKLEEKAEVKPEEVEVVTEKKPEEGQEEQSEAGKKEPLQNREG